MVCWRGVAEHGIGGSRGGGLGARAPPRPFEMDFFDSYFFVGVRVLPNWLIDS